MISIILYSYTAELIWGFVYRSIERLKYIVLLLLKITFVAMHVLQINGHRSNVHRSSSIVICRTQAKSREMQSRGHTANVDPTDKKVAITSTRKDSTTQAKPLLTASRLYRILLSAISYREWHEMCYLEISQ